MVTPHWIIQKLQYLVAELRSISILYIQRCLSSRNAPFGEIKLDDRLTQGHVLHDLVHRRFVVQRAGAVRIYADVRGREYCEQRGIIDTARERDQFVQLKSRCKFLNLLQFGPTPDDDELGVVAVSSPADVLD